MRPSLTRRRPGCPQAHSGTGTAAKTRIFWAAMFPIIANKDSREI